MTWVIAVLVVAAALREPVEVLALVLLPLAALAIGLDLLFPSRRLLPEDASLGLQLHIMFSIFAYSLLSIAALQAVLIAIGDYHLRHRRPTPVMHWLPPLATMETLLFQLIGVGFILLTLSLASGLPFISDLMEQHLAHKTVLSITAWVVFAVLLYGRYRFGWRGRTAIRWTLAGFLLLMLAYFGTKVVLEIILKRV